MINKYKVGGKELKEHKVKGVKSGTSKTGSDYTICQITESKKKEGGGYDYDTFTVFTWAKDLNLEEDDKIVLEDIYAIDVVENEFNGKKYLKKTIFANIKITAKANPNKVDVVGDLPNIDNIPEPLPF